MAQDEAQTRRGSTAGFAHEVVCICAIWSTARDQVYKIMTSISVFVKDFSDFMVLVRPVLFATLLRHIFCIMFFSSLLLLLSFRRFSWCRTPLFWNIQQKSEKETLYQLINTMTILHIYTHTLQLELAKTPLCD